MASPHEGRSKKGRETAANDLIVKEGFLCKKGGVIKSWSRRYFVLNRQSLCYFKRELNAAEGTDLQPMGRVFLSDVVNIETDGVEKKKSFVFALHTKKRAVLLQASNSEDKEKWISAVRQAMETDNKAEREDPFRRTLRKLKPGKYHIYCFCVRLYCLCVRACTCVCVCVCVCQCWDCSIVHTTSEVKHSSEPYSGKWPLYSLLWLSSAHSVGAQCL